MLAHMHNRLPEAEFVATWNTRQPTLKSERIYWQKCNISVESEVEQLYSICQQRFDHLNWCINTIGILHSGTQGPEKAADQLNPQFFLHNIQANTLPTLLLAKHLGKLYDKREPGVFATISAKVGSIEDNHLGGWYSYRCSKAALNMALKTLSIEWQRSLPRLCVAALHPGTTRTALSEPFTKRVPDHKLFPPEQTASYLFDILQKLQPQDTGKFWSWDGSELPW